MCKMLKISAETYAKNCIHNIIDKEKMLWLRKKDIGEKLGVENIYDLIDKEVEGRFENKNPTNEQIREYKRHVSELIDYEKLMYTHEDIIMPIIMHCRVSKLEAIEFKTRLRFNQHDLIMTKTVSTNDYCVKSVQIWSFFWSLFSHIRTEYREISLRIQSKYGKIQTRKTPYLDTFHVVENNESICK